MRFTGPLITSFAGLFMSAAVRRWMGTMEYKVAYYDPTVDPTNPACHGQKIYIFWHEYILAPLYLRGNCNLAMLLSRHRDAEILSRVAYHMGFDCVRGSTYKEARPCAASCSPTASNSIWRSRPTARADRGARWPPAAFFWRRSWGCRWC